MVVLLVAALAEPPPAAAPSPCRDPQAITRAVLALEPSPATCMDGRTGAVGPAGYGLTVAPSGAVTGFVDTDDAALKACWAERLEALVLPEATCELRLSWPLSVDPRP